MGWMKAVVGIDSQQAHPVGHALSEISVQKPERADSNGDES
jgi:hypothetical protein